MHTALLKTLACKHKTTVNKIAARHTAKVSTPHGLRTCTQAIMQRDGRPPLTARFGGIPLVRKKDAVLVDQIPVRPPRRKELITRLLNGICEAWPSVAPTRVWGCPFCWRSASVRTWCRHSG